MFKKALLYSVMIGLMLNNPAFAQKKVIKLTPRQAISYYAQRGNVEKLKELTQKYNIDLTDADGNTALCESILKKDKKGFKTLLELGADKKATCVEKIPEETYNDFINSSEKTTAPSISSKTTKGVPLAAEETGTFLGMGALGWGITGTVVAGGVIAAAAGGGGGGGSSNNSSNETPTKPENVCLDYPLTTCPTNANCSSCPDDSTKLKVVSCEDGYDFYGTNECHVTLACENGTQQGNSCVCNDGYELIGNVCTIKSCPINYYKSNNTCIACPANSSSPAGSISFEQCSCDSGYIMMNGSCVIQESKAGYIFKNGTDLNTTVHVNNEYISINTTDLSDITKGIFYLSSNNDNIIPTLENNAKIALLKDEEHSFSIYGVNLLNSSLVNNGEIVVEEASGVKALSSSVTNNNSLTFSGTNRYGIYGDEATIENNGTIVSSTGGYGIYASNSTIYNRANASKILSAPSSPKTTYGIYAIGSNIGNYGNITSNGYGDFYGIYASNSTIFNDKISLIELTKSADMVYGNYAIDSTVENNGTIKLLGSKNVVGIYVERGSVYNGANSNIEIKASGGSSAIAYGGYAVDSSFTHLGTIKLLGSSVGTAYGLYSNGNTSNVNLNGVIEVLPSYASAIYGIHATGGNIIAGEKSVINIKSSSADAYKAYGV